jgi:hypothetical protein
MYDLPEPLMTVSPNDLSGESIDARAGQFGVLVTVDEGNERPVALVPLRVPSNRLPALLPLVPALLKALAEVRPGEVREIAG